MKRIIKVWCSSLPYKRLLSHNHEEIKERLQKDHGVILPEWDEICRKDQKYLYVFMNYCAIQVWYNDGTGETLRIKAGWMTDLASVPVFLRSLVDDNAPWIILAALWHDAGFAAHFWGFRQCNYNFLDIMTCEKAPRIRKRLSFAAVNNPIIYHTHYKKSAKEIAHERKFLTVEKL